VKKLVTGILLIGILQPVFAFESAYADSLFSEARKKKGNDAIEYMLNHYYDVFNQNYDDGIVWMKNCLNLSQFSSNQELKGRSHLCLGSAYYLRGNYPECLTNYQQALAIFEASNNRKYIGRTCNEFSVYWRKQKNFDKALEYLDRSYQTCVEAQDTICIETSLNNRAVIYEMMGKYDQALVYYKKAEEVALSINNQLGLAYIYSDWAECLRLQGNLNEALLQIDQSILMMTLLNNLPGLALTLFNKASVYMQMGDPDNGIKIFKECMQLCEKIKYADLLAKAHFELGKAYAETGAFEVSFYHMDRSSFLHDSLLNQEKIKSLAEMEVKYETEKIENNLLIEKQERIESELKLANRNKWLTGLGGFFAASVFLALFLYQRKSRIAQAEKDAAVISEREKGIQAVFEATEEERRRIARDLHDGIGQQMSGLKLAWQNLSNTSKSISEQDQHKLQELSSVLDSAASELRDISHQMMPKVLDAFGLIPALEQMIEKTDQHTAIHCEFEAYNVEDRLPQKIEIALFRISQELINNILKHAQASHVSLQVYKNSGQLILVVSDDGKGFSDQKLTDGHGFLNIKSRLNTIHGVMDIESHLNKGTTVTIRVPVGSA
jgi:signal transduction histidine kinase